MKEKERLRFAQEAQKLLKNNPDIKCTSITVYKPRVFQYIRDDGNKLYNYMISLILLDKITSFDQVIFIPDPRAIKVKSGNSLPDYLQTKLWFDHNAKTKLINQPCDSSMSKGIQFADMLSGIIQQHHEDNHSNLFSILEPHIDHRKLYFPK